MYYSIMPKNAKSNETILHPNTKDSDSLRTTIPKFIIDSLDLSKGDKLVWDKCGSNHNPWLKVKIFSGV